MKAITKATFIALVSTVSVCLGAETVYCPVANVTERWTNDALWKVEGEGIRVLSDDAMGLNYGSQTFPITMIGAIKADSLASDGRFVGNYISSAITHIAFDIKRIGLAANAKLRFVGKSGRVWSQTFALPTVVNTWQHYEISMAYSSSWKASGGTAEIFSSDLEQVSDVDILVISSGTASQEVRVDNFKVLGPWEKGPMTADEMPIYWLIENGLSATEGQAGLDKDGDGFSNYAEYLAGTDASDAKSKFEISINIGDDGKPVLSWKRENYRNYKVFKSADLTAVDSFVAEASPIQSVGGQNQVTVNEQSEGSRFYRVQVEKQ